MPVIPPWIQGADPASHMAAGMHIGVQIGAQQAEERFRQQQMAARAAAQQQEMDAQAAAQRFKEVQAARQEQIAARDQALAESKYQLAASQTASKHQAMQEYQSAIAGGMDANEAMLKFGPAMAANTGAAAAIRAHEREMRAPPTPQEITLPSGLKGVVTGNRFQFEPKASSGAVAKVPEGAAFVPATDTTPAHWTTPGKGGGMTDYQNIMERDRTERRLDKLLSDNERLDLSEEAKPDPKWSQRTLNTWKAAKKTADDLRKRIDALEGGQAAPAKTASSKTGRVRVKSPDGKAGSIPADQLDEALSHGYTKAE